ncbi:putative ribonuclease H-like domain-containing protein [Tanacetum coccineum]
MTKTANEQGFLSAVYEGKTHEDLHTCMFFHFLSQEEPKRVTKALGDSAWVEAMQEELLQFKLQKDKRKASCLGYTQEEGIDYDEVFAPVARIEAIRLFLAYASFMGFMVYQMDVKSAFIYGQIEEEVYVCQPPGFEDLDYPDKVYKVVKALYGLHQAPRAWYETLAKYLLDNGFHRGKIDQTLFIKKQKGDILLMSSMGELTFFLGLQVKQKADGIFISQDKYVTDILKKFGFQDVKTASTPMDTEKPMLKDSDGDDVDVHLYRSMIGSLMYLTSSRPDIMFAVCACARFQVTPKVSHSHAVKRIFRYLKGQPKLGLWYPRDSPFDLVAYSDSDYCKKQTVVATSSTEAEYVAAASCCGQDKQIKYLMLNASPLKYCLRRGYLCQYAVSMAGRSCNIKQGVGDRMERAATTTSSLEAEQDSEQFWQTAALSTIEDGVIEITATVDGRVKTITKASIRRHLKLDDSDGISTLPTVETFEQLALIGYVTTSDSLTFQKGHFSP